MLHALGVSSSEERLYRALLSCPHLDVEGLAKVADMSETQAREALDALAALALVRPSRESPHRWWPVAPQRAVEMLLRKKEQAIQQLRHDVEAGRAALEDMTSEFAELPDWQGPIDAERIVGIDAVRNRMEGIAHSATRRCVSVVPGGPVPSSALAASRDLDAELLARGVDQLVLYQDAVRANKPTMAYGRWMIQHGAQVRTAPTLPPRMLIVDERVALLPLDTIDLTVGAVAVTAPGIVRSLLSMFELIWADALPLDAHVPRRPDTGLLRTDHELLRLLADGMTDEAAAVRLGVSLRTVRRRMHDLMKMLDAKSRFEAGLKARDRGWFE